MAAVGHNANGPVYHITHEMFSNMIEQGTKERAKRQQQQTLLSANENYQDRRKSFSDAPLVNNGSLLALGSTLGG